MHDFSVWLRFSTIPVYLRRILVRLFNRLINNRLYTANYLKFIESFNESTRMINEQINNAKMKWSHCKPGPDTLHCRTWPFSQPYRWWRPRLGARERVLPWVCQGRESCGVLAQGQPIGITQHGERLKPKKYLYFFSGRCVIVNRTFML